MNDSINTGKEKFALGSWGLEVCANSLPSALAAQSGGAIRIELCENMAEGGTTPSYGQLKLCKQKLTIEVWPIIRPRGGDFLYSDLEFEVMMEDVRLCKSLSCDGVVIGILTADGEIDSQRCKRLVDLAKPMPVAFHRAFDMSENLENSLEDLIGLGIVRVLTSGGADKALNGVQKIQKLIRQANNRIEIMPGGGVNPDNIKQIYEKTGARTFHSSARIPVSSEMAFKNNSTKLGTINDEYQYQQTAMYLVRDMVNQLKKIQ